MGIILSYCCRQSPVDSAASGDERDEQSRIWSDNSSSNNNQHHTNATHQQYGSCDPPARPIVYQIVLPKLNPVDIDVIKRQLEASSTSQRSTSTCLTRQDGASTQSSPATEESLIVDTSGTQSAPDNESIIINTPPRAAPAASAGAEYPAVIKEEYCAEQFESIRSLILNGLEGQLQFRQLLWSCIPWSARGGKSGSTFMKTLNDQFILKEMSKLELQSFLSIADDYFKYIHHSHHSNQPSLLSTILGIYRIVYTNSETQASSEDYYMVMQNLFFKRNIVQRFDLKGSVRNRLVDTDDPDNTQNVLMDENLLRIACEHPLFIHAKSKQVLNQAIDHDSQFLTSISVMDYSLLVGVDKENKELVLGIIDYVRPFTWDKKIERVVKSVVSAELPTIVEPDLYRERFCEAMDKYFESVPDDW